MGLRYLVFVSVADVLMFPQCSDGCLKDIFSVMVFSRERFQARSMHFARV
jgi:hypothetical protein